MALIKLFEQWLTEDDQVIPNSPDTTQTTTVAPSSTSQGQYTIAITPSEPGSTPVNIIATTNTEYKNDAVSTFNVISSDNPKITAGQLVTISAMSTDKGTYDVVVLSDPPSQETTSNYADSQVTVTKSQGDQPTQAAPAPAPTEQPPTPSPVPQDSIGQVNEMIRIYNAKYR